MKSRERQGEEKARRSGEMRMSRRAATKETNFYRATRRRDERRGERGGRVTLCDPSSSWSCSSDPSRTGPSANDGWGGKRRSVYRGTNDNAPQPFELMKCRLCFSATEPCPRPRPHRSRLTRRFCCFSFSARAAAASARAAAETESLARGSATIPCAKGQQGHRHPPTVSCTGRRVRPFPSSSRSHLLERGANPESTGEGCIVIDTLRRLG